MNALTTSVHSLCQQIFKRKMEQGQKGLDAATAGMDEEEWRMARALAPD